MKPSGEIYIDEIHQAHGGPYGGFAVNGEFEKMVQKMFQFSAEEYLAKYKEESKNIHVSGANWCMIDPKKKMQFSRLNFPQLFAKQLKA